MCCRALVIAMNRPYFYFLFSHFILQFIDLMQYFPPMELHNYSIANCSFSLSFTLFSNWYCSCSLWSLCVHFLWCRDGYIYLFWWNFCVRTFLWIYVAYRKMYPRFDLFLLFLLSKKKKKIEFENFDFCFCLFFGNL